MTLSSGIAGLMELINRSVNRLKVTGVLFVTLVVVLFKWCTNLISLYMTFTVVLSFVVAGM